MEVEALRPTDCASLSLSGNAFADNAGGDLAVRGNVHRQGGAVVGAGAAAGDESGADPRRLSTERKEGRGS